MIFCGVRLLTNSALGWSGEWPSEFISSTVSDVKFSFKENEELPILSSVVFIFRKGGKLEMMQQNADGPLTVIGPDFRVEIGMSLARMHFAIPEIFMHLVFLAGGKEGVQSPKNEKLLKFMRENVGITVHDGNILGTVNVGEEGTLTMEGTLMSGNLAPFAPMRSKPQRTYSILDDEPEHEGGDIPAMMFRMSLRNPEELKDLCRRIDAFGKVTGMFSDVRVVEHGSESGGDFHLELKVGGVESNIMDVGYGVSQIYPMLARIMRASQRGIQAAFLLQQPEVHLHPRAQAELGSFFVESVKKDGHTFLVETHSDFIVDRIRICMADGLIDPKDVALLYFEPQKSKDAVKIHPIELNSKGEPAENPPKGYRDFFLRETERMLGFRD